jgi:hypothetical protein
MFDGGSGVLVLGFGGALGCFHVYNGLISNRYKKKLTCPYFAVSIASELQHQCCSMFG